MKKEKLLSGLCIIGITGTLLTGCGSTIPELSETEEKIVTDYAAQLLLKYDSNYEKKLMDLDYIAQLEEQAALEEELKQPVIEEDTSLDIMEGDPSEPIPEDEQFISDDTVTDVTGESETLPQKSLSELLGLPDFDIQYMGYEVMDSYEETITEEFGVSVDAVAGDKLLVLYFDMTNLSENEQEADILNQYTRFRVFVNDGNQVNTQATLLSNDLSNLKETFAGGETKSTVLIVEMKEEELAEITSVRLTAKLTDDSTTLDLE